MEPKTRKKGIRAHSGSERLFDFGRFPKNPRKGFSGFGAYPKTPN